MSLGTANLNKNEIIIHGTTGMQLIQVDYIYSQIVIVPMKFMYKIVDRNEAKNKVEINIMFGFPAQTILICSGYHNTDVLSLFSFSFFITTQILLSKLKIIPQKPQMIIEITPDH